MQELDLLTEFNHALVYGFEPEASPAYQLGSRAIPDHLFPLAGQFRDMLKAYLHAQNVILPHISAQSMNEEQFLSFINQLHGFIGKTLLGFFNLKSGQYTSETIIRWHHGSMIGHYINEYFSGFHQCKDDPSFVAFVCRETGSDRAAFSNFVQLIRTVAAKPEIPLRDDFKKLLESLSALPPHIAHFKGVLMMSKLYSARALNLLSPSENNLVDQIVKICMQPSDIPNAMAQYATWIIQNIPKGRGVDEISAFLAESFYRLTDIHPFSNGNGRVATCLMNIMLRSFGLPSILLRHPGDKAEATSDYSLAIQTIDQSRLPLQRLIKKRITNAQQSEPFCDLELKRTIVNRVALSDVMERIHSKHPKFELQWIMDQISFEMSKSYAESEGSLLSVDPLQLGIQIAKKKEKELDNQVRMPFLLGAKLTPSQKIELIKSFEQLSNASGWKTNEAKGLVVWLEKSDESEQANKIAATAIGQKLQKAGVAHVIISARSDKKSIWVVKCEQINFQKLQASLLDSVEEPSLGAAAAYS